MLTLDEIKKELSYDPLTGEFKWLNSGMGRNKNLSAGSASGTGYVQITIQYENLLAHRLAVLFMTGEWPSVCVDHIDHNKKNNKWDNLRQCTYSENMQNGRNLKQSSGLRGAYKNKDGKWYSVIQLNKKQHRLGSFDTKEEAHAAYLAAKARLHTSQPTLQR